MSNLSAEADHQMGGEDAAVSDDSAMLAKAIALAAAAHLGQWEKDGTPYILHPIRVMMRVISLPEKTVAILHDVIEDTQWTLDGLRAEGFTEAIIEAVDAVTRRPDESYMDYVERAAAHRLGYTVKLADLEDNLDFKRLPEIDEAAHRRADRYHRAWLHLRRRTAPAQES